MAVFRVQKNKNYTVMSNHHLNDQRISLKAKGLLSYMLSLPDDWDYSLRGLAYKSKENIDAIRTGVLELEQHGYITRYQTRSNKGKMSHTVYNIFEKPQSPPCLENPITDETPCSAEPCLENPLMRSPTSDAPTQLSTNQKNTHAANPNQSNPNPSLAVNKGLDMMDSDVEKMDDCRHKIHKNIEYSILSQQYDPEQLDELVEIMMETLCCNAHTISISGKEYPLSFVRNRLLSLTSMHIQYVIECLDRNTSKVNKIKPYLLATLFNAPATMNHYYSAEVNHDLGTY